VAVARASVFSATTNSATIFNASGIWGSSGSDGQPARAVHVKCLSGSLDVQVPELHGTAWVTLSAAGVEETFATSDGRWIGRVRAKGTSASAKGYFAVIAE
jgi:hypothetical protein